ncbi:GntR family transcriptional regulator [Nocardia africana]|uniref:GntR family transcriptional regulator n=1 Tax=Nocardia africana TaxID=134964 RepID=A0ABW6NVA7_9NOCA
MDTPSRKKPAAQRIADAIRSDIEAGNLRYGQPLPSTRELASEWGASSANVTQAMNRLHGPFGFDNRTPCRRWLILRRPDCSVLVAEFSHTGSRAARTARHA